MGSKPWRALGVLLVTGVALTGCTNAPQKDKSLGAKIGDPPPAKLANNGPNLTGLPNNNNNAFPTANPAKVNNLTPTGGFNNPTSGPNNLLPVSNPGFGNPPLPNFPTNNSNSSFAPSTVVPPANNFNPPVAPLPNVPPSPISSIPPVPAPQGTTPFATERTTVPPLPISDFPPRQ